MHDGAAVDGRLPHLALARMPRCLWQQQQRRRDLPCDRVEIGVAGALHFRAFRFVDAGQHGARDDGKRRLRHVGIDLRDVRGALGAPARRLLLASGDHGGNITKKFAVPEQRACELALPAPVFALRRQEAAADDGLQHATVEPRLWKFRCVLDEDAVGKRRIRHPGDQRPLLAVKDDRFFIDGARQRAQRIAHEAGDKGQERQRPRRRLHRGRVKRGRLCSDTHAPTVSRKGAAKR